MLGYFNYYCMYVVVRYFVVVARSVLGGGFFMGQASRGFGKMEWEIGRQFGAVVKLPLW